MACLGIDTSMGTKGIMHYNFKSEAEFGKTVQYMFNQCGYESWQEVHTPYGNIDMVLKKHDKYYAVELKLSLSDTVCDQAYNNKLRVAGIHSVVLVPTKNVHKYELSRVKHYFLSKFEIGLWLFNCNAPAPIEDLELKVSEHSNDIKTKNWVAVLSEELYPKVSQDACDIAAFLNPDQKCCVAGSPSGGCITPFKRSCDLIIDYLQKNPTVTRKQLYITLQDQLHWASYNSMCSSLRTYTKLEPIQKINALLANNA